MMNALASWMLWELGRTTLCLAAVGIVLAILLRLARVRSSIVHRAACCVVLLMGWALVRLPVEIPWYAAPEATSPTHASLPAKVAPPLAPLPSMQIDEDFIASKPGVAVEPPASEQPHASKLLVRPLVAAPASAPPNVAESIDWRNSTPLVLLLTWIAGIVVIVGWWAFSYLRFVRSLPCGVPADREWETQWQRLQKEHGGERILLQFTEVNGPLLCWWPGRTVLLVPRVLWVELSAVERRAVLLHELEHYRRGDLWKSLAARLLALPHWFNPVAWLTVRRFDEAAEWACDQAATGDDATGYARMLLRLASLVSEPDPFGSAMSNLPLTNRIRRLLVFQNSEDSTMKRAMLLTCVLLLLPAALVRVQLVARPPEVAAPPSAIEPVPAEPENPPEPNATAVEVPAVLAAKQKMLQQAKRAFLAHDTAYESGVVLLDSVFAWSNRWLAAELALATTQEEQLAAIHGHLERMQRRQKAVQQLHDVGAHGGEATQLAAANYFVADAERKLAEIQATSQSRVQAEQPEANREMADTARRAFEETQQAYRAGNAPLDEVFVWSIKWLTADLAIAGSRGEQIAAARANFERIKELHAGIAALNATGTRGGDQQQMETANYYLADAKRRLSQFVPQSTANSSKELPMMTDLSGLPVIPDRALRYDGKTFDEWVQALKTDLSPTLAKQAMEAMGAFATRGKGPEVAATIFDVMQDHSVWIIDSGTVGQFQIAAVQAAARVPAEELWPSIKKTMATGNTNQQIFAVRAMPLEDRNQSIPVLEQAMQSSDPKIVLLAREKLTWIDHDNPLLIRLIQEDLSSRDAQRRMTAVAYVQGLDRYDFPLRHVADGEPYLQFLPEAVALLEDEDEQVRTYAKSVLTGRKSQLRNDKYKAQVAAILTKMVEDGGPHAKTAEELLNQIVPPSATTIDRRR